MDDSLHNKKNVRMLEMVIQFERYMETRNMETIRADPGIITGAEVMILTYLMRYMLQMHDEEVDELLDRLIEILEAVWQEKDRKKRFSELQTDLMGNMLELKEFEREKKLEWMQ